MLHHYYPNLVQIVGQELIDPRRVKSCKYPIASLVLSAVMMYMLRKGSRNGMNEERYHEEFRQNYRKILGLELPHMDTVNALFKCISPEQLQVLQQSLIRILLSKRVLHKFRLLKKYFVIAIDGTGVFNFTEAPYAGCPHRRSKNGKVTYYQNVVEAKLVCPNGFSISISSEWIRNEDGQKKQDCEYKATMRLLSNIKQAFPRLAMCIVLDGLYLKYPLQQAIINYGWEYIIVWKDKSLYPLQEEIQNRLEQGKLHVARRIKVHNTHKRTEYEYTYDSAPLQNKDLESYFAKCIKTEKSVRRNTEDNSTKFMFMTSIPVTHANYIDIIEAGRMRWKIENEGFNVQKNQGYALHHKMNRKNINAIKNYYTCLQIAHLFSQLLTLCINTVCKHYKTMKMLWNDFLSLLRMIADYEPRDLSGQRFNFRY